MSRTTIYTNVLQKKQKNWKLFVVLIDPDKTSIEHIDKIITLAIEAKVDYFFVGGSLLMQDHLNECLDIIRKNSNIPTILFPGNPLQVNAKADALLFLSLISGRNPELLIGQHVIAAPYLKQSGLEVIPTGYMLIDGGRPTTASYMSGTTPIPANKPEIAACTAMAGEMLGLKNIYMDAGSGANQAVNIEMIEAVSSSVSIPIMIGGGIRNPELAYQNTVAGADVIVVGNAIEKDPQLILEMAAAVHTHNPKVSS